MGKRPHTSYSAVAQYQRCPLQYYFQRILKLPSDTVASGLVLGGAVHEALAEYHKVRDEESAGVYDFTTTLAPLTELPPFFRVTMDAMSKSQEWTDRMLGLIGGVVEAPEIYAPDALERLYDDAGVPQDQRIYDPAG